MHIGATWDDWRPALKELIEFERPVWIVSPWITSCPQLPNGAKILTRLNVEDLARGATKFEVIKVLCGQPAVEIRSVEGLHAKVYATELGSHLWGWTTSANLTARSADNEEVLHGPTGFSEEFTMRLQRLWESAKPVTAEVLTGLESQVEERRLQYQLQRTIVQNVLTVQISTRAGLGRFSLSPELLGLNAKGTEWRGVTDPGVPYLDTSWVGKFRHKFQAAISKLTSGESPLLVPLSGRAGLYALKTEDREAVESTLKDWERRVKRDFEDVIANNREEINRDFTQRLAGVAQEYNDELKDLRPLLRKAEAAIDGYLHSPPVGLEFAFLLPLLPTSEHPWNETLLGIADRPTRLFTSAESRNAYPGLLGEQ
jgi:hypothetical protein